MRRRPSIIVTLATCLAIVTCMMASPASAGVSNIWTLPLTKSKAKLLVKLGWGSPSTTNFKARCRITSATRQTCRFTLRYMGADGVYRVRGRAFVKVAVDGSSITNRRVKYRKIKQCRVEGGSCFYGPRSSYADHFEVSSNSYVEDSA